MASNSIFEALPSSQSFFSRGEFIFLPVWRVDAAFKAYFMLNNEFRIIQPSFGLKSGADVAATYIGPNPLICFIILKVHYTLIVNTDMHISPKLNEMHSQ